VRSSNMHSVAAAIPGAYRKRTGQPAQVFSVRPAAGAQVRLCD